MTAPHLLPPAQRVLGWTMKSPVRMMLCFVACSATAVAAFHTTPAPFPASASGFAARCRAGKSLRASTTLRLRMKDQDPSEKVDYNNKVIEMFGGMLKSTDLDQIDWKVQKREGLPLAEMSDCLEAGLREREWFVTGNIMPELFSEKFKFQDPDVKLEGVENYARGVNKLFDPCSRAEIVDCRVSVENNCVSRRIHIFVVDQFRALTVNIGSVNTDKPNTVTVTWRLSGKVKLGPGVTIKPYVVYTDLVTDPSSGLVVFQEDRFSIPGWDLLLSAFLPFLQPLLTPPAPPVEELIKTFAEGGRV